VKNVWAAVTNKILICRQGHQGPTAQSCREHVLDRWVAADLGIERCHDVTVPQLRVAVFANLLKM
jgi:hypothetical protein